jgi:membrane protease YdiL (CAAX protease family)
MAGPLTGKSARVPPEATGAAAAALLLYTLVIAGALLWLWWRDDLGALPELALGRFGVLGGAGIGLLAGMLGAACLALASRWLAAVRRIEGRIGELVGPIGESALLTLALVSAVAEELLFRVAGQRAFGFSGSVALYVLGNTGPGFWAWAPVALVFGLMFATMIETGCGLLAVTTAHALLNYFSLRRILPT